LREISWQLLSAGVPWPEVNLETAKTSAMLRIARKYHLVPLLVDTHEGIKQAGYLKLV
jgi:hypothetical protein